MQKKLIQVEVEVENDAQLADMQKTLDLYGFKFTSAKEIHDAMTGKSPLAAGFIKKLVYKRGAASPFSLLG